MTTEPEDRMIIEMEIDAQETVERYKRDTRATSRWS